MSLLPSLLHHYSFITFQLYTIISNDIICFSTARLIKREAHLFCVSFLEDYNGSSQKSVYCYNFSIRHKTKCCLFAPSVINP